MEIEKRSIHKSIAPGVSGLGFVAEEDYNIPEYKPDVQGILKKRGTVEIGDVTVEENAVILQGNLCFEILYQGEGSGEALDVLNGSMAFQERVSMDGACQQENLFLKSEVEDLGVVIINSRKLSLRGICRLELVAMGSEEVELPMAPGVGEDEQILLEDRKILKLLEQRKDRIRFRQELSLPKEKPNVQKLVWKEVHLEQVNLRQSGEGLEISGMLGVFVLYYSGTEEAYVWYETSVPVSQHIACEIPKTGSFYQVKPMGRQTVLEIREDLDGELRSLHAECTLEVKLSIWQEEELELLKDAYSLSRELYVHRHEEELWQIAMKNETMLPLESEIHLAEGREAMYLCNTEAVLKSVTTAWKENHIAITGEWDVEVLYLTTDDRTPFACAFATVPFQGELEAGAIQEGDYIEVDASMYRLQSTLGDSGRILLRGEVLVQLMAYHKELVLLPDDVVEEELDMEQLQKQPGMIGYVVREGDCLWDIARKYHTTRQELMETNELEKETLQKGQKLLVQKRIYFPG